MPETVRNLARKLGFDDHKVLSQELRTWLKSNNISKDEMTNLAEGNIIKLVEGFLKENGSRLWPPGRSTPCVVRHYDAIKNNLTELYKLQQHHRHLNAKYQPLTDGNENHEVPVIRRSERGHVPRSFGLYASQEEIDSPDELQDQDSHLSVPPSDTISQQPEQANAAGNPLFRSPSAPFTENARTSTEPAGSNRKRNFDELEDCHISDNTSQGLTRESANTATVSQSQLNHTGRPEETFHMYDSQQPIDPALSPNSRPDQALREASLGFSKGMVRGPAEKATPDTTTATDRTQDLIASTSDPQLPNTRCVRSPIPEILNPGGAAQAWEQTSPPTAPQELFEVYYNDHAYCLNAESLHRVVIYVLEYLQGETLKDAQGSRAPVDHDSKTAIVSSLKRLRLMKANVGDEIGKVSQEQKSPTTASQKLFEVDYNDHAYCLNAESLHRVVIYVLEYLQGETLKDAQGSRAAVDHDSKTAIVSSLKRLKLMQANVGNEIGKASKEQVQHQQGSGQQAT